MGSAVADGQAILLDPRDNVATALVSLPAGQTVSVGGNAVTLQGAVPQGHKFASRAIGAAEPVIKYGQPIGRATADIEPGEHVHVHNLASQRGSASRPA